MIKKINANISTVIYLGAGISDVDKLLKKINDRVSLV